MSNQDLGYGKEKFLRQPYGPVEHENIFIHLKYDIAFIFKAIGASEMFARAAKRGVFKSLGRKKTGNVAECISARRTLKKSLSLWRREGIQIFPIKAIYKVLQVHMAAPGTFPCHIPYSSTTFLTGKSKRVGGQIDGIEVLPGRF